MEKSCTLVEFAGIPYSWKTSTMTEVQRQLRSSGVITYSVQEFRGAEEFYDQRKLTPDINILRALNFMREFIQVARDGRTRVVLVDRGLFDSLCWVKWFKKASDVPPEYENVISALLLSVHLFAEKYRIVWMDRDPLEAIRNHGQQTGRVVNFHNLTSLRDVYSSELEGLQFSATSYRMDSDSGTAQQVASQIVNRLKLT